MTDNRHAAFFDRLERLAQPTELPPRWISRRAFPDPVDRFRKMQAAVKGEVLVSDSFSSTARAVSSALADLGVADAVLNTEAPLDRLRPEDFPGIDLHRLSPGDPIGWRSRCASAGAGITGADAMLAETGTVVCSSGPGRSRLVSLLPPIHVVICPASRFRTDIFTWLAEHGGSWPANTVLISGPSKTADIEQTMSVGMHGPKKLLVFIYREED